MEKDEMEKTTAETKQAGKEQKRSNNSSFHSLNELLQVAMDMGDQRVIDAIKKKMEE
jgi:predicted kinase